VLHFNLITVRGGASASRTIAAPSNLKEQMAHAIQSVSLMSLFDSGSKLPPRKAIFLRLLCPVFLEGFNPYQLPA
jgi:hypothetical protein